mmetsp:Transcript_17734/g.34139  ORF Transcript_17734/g.34139 Transcript_17734/m.34139 type:complete len:90 (-) Transcript_17734:848-1117(-)
MRPSSCAPWLVERYGRMKEPAPLGAASAVEHYDHPQHLHEVIGTGEKNHKHYCKLASPQVKITCSRVPEVIADAQSYLLQSPTRGALIL